MLDMAQEQTNKKITHLILHIPSLPLWQLIGQLHRFKLSSEKKPARWKLHGYTILQLKILECPWEAGQLPSILKLQKSHPYSTVATTMDQLHGFTPKFCKDNKLTKTPSMLFGGRKLGQSSWGGQGYSLLPSILLEVLVAITICHVGSYVYLLAHFHRSWAWPYHAPKLLNTNTPIGKPSICDVKVA